MGLIHVLLFSFQVICMAKGSLLTRYRRLEALECSQLEHNKVSITKYDIVGNYVTNERYTQMKLVESLSSRKTLYRSYVEYGYSWVNNTIPGCYCLRIHVIDKVESARQRRGKDQ